jgi:phage terminase small subunit
MPVQHGSALKAKAPWAVGLNAKQERFVREYVVDLNATQAALRAGYTKVSAGSSGHLLLKRAEVARAVDALLAQEVGVTRTRIVDELARVGFANAGDFFEWGPDGVVVKSSADLTEAQLAAVVEVAETKPNEKGGGGSIRVRLGDKIGSLAALAKLLGMIREKVEVGGKDGGPIETKDVSDRDRVKAIAFLIARSEREKAGDGDA